MYRPVNLLTEFSRYVTRKTLFGSAASLRFIVQGPTKFFDEAQRVRLERILLSDREYFWFNDIPIYHVDDWKSFLENGRNVDATTRQMKSGDFEFNIFAYHLLLERGWTLEPVEGSRKDASFLESQKSMSPEMFACGIHRMQPMWCIEPEQVPSAFMQFHRDRR